MLCLHTRLPLFPKASRGLFYDDGRPPVGGLLHKAPAEEKLYPTSAPNSFWLKNLFLVALEQLGDSLEEIRASGGNMLGPAYGVKSITELAGW
ncbi:protein ycf2 [Phtheirospermum japonicum]|uniref:Protein ycf2 n=1 Tax=Phtheirospermum japonicum TaxID=374723 RepID=A0A830CIU7_9LAMI|nr:protein ycf2 [Phtheirospermum japonicum]